MAEKIVEAISEESIEKIAGGFNVTKKKALEVFKKVGIPVLALGVGAAAGAAAGSVGTLGYLGQGPFKKKDEYEQEGSYQDTIPGGETFEQEEPYQETY